MWRTHKHTNILTFGLLGLLSQPKIRLIMWKQQWMKVYISMTVSVVTSVWKLIIIIWEDRVSCDEQPSFPALNILCCAGNMSSQHRMCPHSPPPHLPRLQRNPLTLPHYSQASSFKLRRLLQPAKNLHPVLFIFIGKYDFVFWICLSNIIRAHLKAKPIIQVHKYIHYSKGALPSKTWTNTITNLCEEFHSNSADNS